MVLFVLLLCRYGEAPEGIPCSAFLTCRIYLRGVCSVQIQRCGVIGHARVLLRTCMAPAYYWQLKGLVCVYFLLYSQYTRLAAAKHNDRARAVVYSSTPSHGTESQLSRTSHVLLVAVYDNARCCYDHVTLYECFI